MMDCVIVTKQEFTEHTSTHTQVSDTDCLSPGSLSHLQWENSFKTAVMDCRNEEAKILKLSAYWQGLFGVVLFSGPLAVAIGVFGSYTLAGNTLGPAQAYAALSLFSLLRFPMSFLPILITQVINALVALRRIGVFLDRSEAPMTEVRHVFPFL